MDESRPSSHTTEPTPQPGVFTRQRMTTLALLIVTAIAVYLCYLIVQPFLPALTWALALAVMARPVHHGVRQWIRWPDAAAAVSTTLVAMLLLAPVVLLTWHVVSQPADYARQLEDLQEQAAPRRLEQAVEAWSPRLGRLVEWGRENLEVEEGMRQALTGVGGRLTTAVSGSVWLAAQLAITLLVLFFLFRDEQQAIDTVRNYLPLSRREASDVLRRVDDTIHATIYGTILVAAVQGALGGLMFWWLDLPVPVFWGVVMGLLAVIPYLGAFLVWGPAAAYLAFQGNWGSAIALTLWGLIVVGLIDNLLYPIFVGNRLRQHTLVAFFAIVGGVWIFGASGLVLGPVIVSTTAALLDIWWRRTALGHAADEP